MPKRYVIEGRSSIISHRALMPGRSQVKPDECYAYVQHTIPHYNITVAICGRRLKCKLLRAKARSVLGCENS